MPAVQTQSRTINTANLIARLTRDQAPEFEQTLNFAVNTLVPTPTSIRTDRKIAVLTIHGRGRFTNAATGPTLRTAPPLLGTVIFSLVQEIRIRGQHLKYGSQYPFVQRGEGAVEFYTLMYPAYIPQFSISQNGGALTRSGAIDVTAAHTNDFDFEIPIPLYPANLNANDIPFYCIHGPDWPGNIYVDLLFADGTALATANPPTSFTAFGSGAGNPTFDILTTRPLLGKDLMAQIKPAVPFRIYSAQQPTTAVSTVSGTGVKFYDCIVGKDTTRLFVKSGTQGANETAGVVAFGSLSDAILTRPFPSLDVRPLRFTNAANTGSVLQDQYAQQGGRAAMPTGYQFVDFVSQKGDNFANPKAAFPSSKLTAARKFEWDSDITAAGNQIAEVSQEMLLGTAGLATS